MAAIWAGSVRLVWSTGFSGLTMLLQPRGDTLEGIARTFWDFNRPTQTAAVIATRVSCNAPLLPANVVNYRYPRGIALDGDSVLVGVALPSGVRFEQVSERRFRAPRPAAGPFADASQILVNLGPDGRVADIRGECFGRPRSHRRSSHITLRPTHLTVRSQSQPDHVVQSPGIDFFNRWQCGRHHHVSQSIGALTGLITFGPPFVPRMSGLPALTFSPCNEPY